MDAIGTVVGQFTDLYEKQEYATAYAYLTQAQPAHPLYRAAFLAWRAGMAARSDQHDLALDLLEEAVQAGFWYHEDALTQDPDYASLQAEPRFQQMVSICAQRRAQAEAEVQPQRTLLEPQGFAGPRPLLLALHGNLGNKDLMAPYWQKAVELGYRVAVLQSTQPMWLSGFYSWDDHEIGLGEVRDHYRQICEQVEVDPAQVFIAGFSSGGGLAAHAALAGIIPARGFIALEYFSTAWDKPETWESWFGDHPASLRAVLQLGIYSPEMLEGTRVFASQLDEHGIANRTFQTPNMVHAIPDPFEPLLAEMLAYLAE